MTISKKIIIISLIFNSILFSIFIIYKKINNNTLSLENNIVKVIKEAEIINNNKNPSGIFLKNKNISENILNGFFISSNTIVTANHGTNGDEVTYKIIDINNKSYNGKLIISNQEDDIALIKLDSEIEQFKEIKFNNKYKIGDKVFSISYGESIVVKSGVILDIKDNIIYTDIVFDAGESGSALFNESSEIIGINLEVDLENNIGISYDLEFLEK